ncbi:MAG: TIGR03885 family FMN-dependent LLM class oxidoreductase [Methanomicrobiaceae archaeon]|nr:TIGR03885 family FMN-dependent LLM class oxidoreductase [Methanomicrobiaceae archaeon]
MTDPELAIGYHASHEQFRPSSLLQLAHRAEHAGFGSVLSSDHFHPWSWRQGESGFAWSWLGAALQATSLSAGVVCAPVQRYHPAIIAQAAATLAEMYPGRFFVAVGSGQVLNEGICGEACPPKQERNERLREAAAIMRRLWAGETVTTTGPIRTVEAHLHTRAAEPPALLGAALSADTAEWVGGWADGLITVARPPEDLRDIAAAFSRGGGAGKERYLKVDLSYARTHEEAVAGAHDQWRANILSSTVLENLRTPGQFDAAAAFITPDEVAGEVRVSADPEEHIEWLKADIGLGFSRLYLHNVNRDQDAFIEDFGNEVLPALTG